MTGGVRRRHVFFVSGFDPKGPSFLHGIYRREARAQGSLTGTRYEVGPREPGERGNCSWRVASHSESGRTDTVFEIARWDDIVRAQWPRNGWQVFLGSLRGYRAALASPAALGKVWEASRRTLISLAFPIVYWLSAALLAAACGLAVAAWLDAAWPVKALLALLAAGAVWWGAVRWDRQLATSWLLRIYQFVAEWREGRVPALEPRIDQLAADIRQRLDDPDIDEVLVVGFSVGSLLAVSAVARLHRAAEGEGKSLERLSLLTLGHCIPLLGLMKGADPFRAELARLGRAPRVNWVDFSSITDWGSFALVDPLELCLGPGGAGRPYAPRMLSPRFHTMFGAEAYARLVRDKRRIHLQYLMAGERPAFYDYFALTAGPSNLPERMSRMPAP
jgi:hypothetical protein